MRGKIALGMIIIILLLTAVTSRIAPTSAWEANGITTLAAPEIINTSLIAGSTFSIEVTVDEVSSMWSYTIVLSYNTDVLTATGAAPWSPPPPPPIPFPPFNTPLASAIDDTAGYVYISACTFYGDDVGVATTEPMPIAQIDFSVDARGLSRLDLHDTKIIDVNADTMAHEVVDGYFLNTLLGDADGDGYVGSADFSILAGAYGSSVGDPAFDARADFDLDGYIGSSDFSILAGNYGKTV